MCGVVLRVMRRQLVRIPQLLGAIVSVGVNNEKAINNDGFLQIRRRAINDYLILVSL